MADLTTLQTWLTEAETALHRLLIGSLQENVEHADMRVTYTRTDITKLQAYVASLRGQITAMGGTVTGMSRRGFVIDL